MNKDDEMQEDSVEEPKKKYTSIRGKTISELAKDILFDNKERKENIDEKIRELFPDIEPPTQEEKQPERINIQQGLDSHTAFQIKDEREIQNILTNIFKYQIQGEGGMMFWTVEGGYFIFNETIVTKQNKKFKVLSIEDRNGFRYQLWFELTSQPLFYSY